MLIACTTTDSLLPDRRPDYRQSRVASPLEIPPDLTASTVDDVLIVPQFDPTGSATLSDYAGERAASMGVTGANEPVLQSQPGVRLERDGQRRWLVVQTEPSQLWPKIREFWTTSGIPLKREHPNIGIMETEWVENRADIPEGPLRRLIGRAIDFAYSAPTRDRFRVRLERIAEGSEVYLTHYGVEEVARGAQGEHIVWQSRPADPELEAEMLKRLMVHLGVSERRVETELARAETPVATPRARLVEGVEGQRALVIEEDYARAWRLVGLALDDSYFVIEDQNRNQGLYVVEYRQPLQEEQGTGFLSRLAFWKDQPPPSGSRYQVRLAAQGPQTLVLIYTPEGQPDNSATAGHILETLREVIG